MATVQFVTGVVQQYAWGDPTFIPSLLGVEPDGRPWAELWLGTHPGGPATLDDGTALSALTGRLPYLLKVLAAGDALSLQTHPSKAQAETGFARENDAGIALDASNRIYRDPFPKPELICALTPFDALCGFRPLVGSAALLDDLGLPRLASRLRREGLPAMVRHLYRGEIDLAPIVDVCAAQAGAEARLVTQLAEQYPDDPSVAVTLLLHRVQLRPGEAIFLGPGNLHAYLSGAGIEIMAASDNVVRGGMTTKHVDVEELLDVLDIRAIDDPRVRATEAEPGSWRYDTPDTPFRLWRHEIAGRFDHVAESRELAICCDGSTDTIDRGGSVALRPGERLQLTGIATVFIAEEVAT
jgi:mannose-6-phosphate isomerase